MFLVSDQSKSQVSVAAEISANKKIEKIDQVLCF